MAISSMTGFARAEGRADGLSWTWEVKSVNSRALDLRFRLPPGFDGLEPALRAALAKHVKRGSISASLTVTNEAGAAGLKINRAALATILAAAKELAPDLEAAPPRLDGLLALRGVIETGEEPQDEEARERRDAALLKSWDDGLARLAAARVEEGARLEAVLVGHLAHIAELVGEAAASAAAQPAALRERLRSLVAELLEAAPALNEDRLAQEAALLAAKADVREEIDRLNAHVAAARGLLAEGGAIGRRFDFLCQEFNREANTLCSKSSDLALTRIGLALKAAIEQLREQVQNIE
ncbi:MAG TPA: YicC/YloC family endoribonuclease [Stellaceae bacterium]|nr:YicC/YloC family endoribonuclease [Stellaceae bacterium]